ncbi:HutD family protein [Thalassotalea sp. G2M2-11]|uniref:HutD/Ves family protein n=1 Tax=Thalassotalea sp. G2M2-11 TaxID=2787627 RepID=UPI0019CF7A3C|nr:HutD family protein [Thalassotalea sp. G2M2-11]
MYLIKTASQFITTPWKNGLGETTELAINTGGTITDFDWRISMATVSENGEFSNFAGYYRQLTLLSGNGINLHHQRASNGEKLPSDQLLKPLDIAEFDGANITYGELIDGKIVDLNVITNQQSIKSKVTAVTRSQTYEISTTDLLQVFAVSENITINLNANNESLTLAKGELFQWLTSESKTLEILGNNYIVIALSEKNNS